MEAEQPLYYHMHVGTITFYLSLTLCGQLGSSNHSALFILTNNLSLTHSLLTLVSLRMTQLYLFLSALSFLVICVQCYIGPCGVLVPTGTVHSNNEFEFECVSFRKLCTHTHSSIALNQCMCSLEFMHFQFRTGSV